MNRVEKNTMALRVGCPDCGSQPSIRCVSLAEVGHRSMRSKNANCHEARVLAAVKAMAVKDASTADAAS